MSAQDAEQRRPGGGDAVEHCIGSITQPGASREPISLAEALALLDDPWFRTLYEIVFGHFEAVVERRVVAEVAERMRVDRDLDPADPVEAAAARRRRSQYARPAKTPAQIRAQAEYSWRRAEREYTEQQGQAG